jgi:thioredoxin-like negative regulator of GroEL
MESSPLTPDLARIVEQYRVTANIGTLIDGVRTLAAHSDPEQLALATRPYHDMPEVVIPAYEHIVAARPNDAQAMVLLANAYWLTGRGSEVVGALAGRAKEADAHNRGAWHLWALSEANIRGRVDRWREVTRRFPQDQLARAALADNAASLAGADDDPAALDLAITTYESLLADATYAEQRTALEATLRALRKR